MDIFRPENAGDTLKLFLNWDGMGKLMLDSLVDADNRGEKETKYFSRYYSIGAALAVFSSFIFWDP